MKVLDFKHIEDCFDGSYIKEVLLDTPISADFIRHLGKLGSLQYFPDFPRPFFRIDSEKASLKGIQDNNTFRATVYYPEELENIKDHINRYQR
ncbi:MAG: hypothetical protein GY757_49495 [bacterium]|nr:hypothetical protein [bacterium]